MRQSLRVPPSWPTLQRHFEKRRSSVAPSRPDQRMLLRFCSDHQEEVSLLDLGHSNLLLPLWLGRPRYLFQPSMFEVTAMFWESRKDSSRCLLSYKKARNDGNPHWNPWMPANRLWAWIRFQNLSMGGHHYIVFYRGMRPHHTVGARCMIRFIRHKTPLQQKKAKSYRTSFTALKMVGDLGHRKEEEMPKTPNQPTNLNHQHPRWRTKAFRTVLQKTFRSCQSCHTLLADSRFHPALLEQNHQRSWKRRLGGKPGVSSKRKWLR